MSIERTDSTRPAESSGPAGAVLVTHRAKAAPARVAEIMATDLVTVPDDAVLAEAVLRMDEHEIRHLPVVRGGSLVGVVSDRDLLEHADRLVARAGGEGELEAPRVREVMQPKPVTVLPEDTIAFAAETLAAWGIGCLPVTRDGALVGQVTETDVLDTFVAATRYGRLGELDPPVHERMTTELVTVTPETTLREAAELMDERDVRHLLVTEAAAGSATTRYGELVALVSDRDLRRAAGKGAPESTPVVDAGARLPITASPYESISHAARRMADRRFGALPVVDPADRLVGILTVTDVLAHCAQALA